jgi:cytochrome c peroxidase
MTKWLRIALAGIAAVAVGAFAISASTGGDRAPEGPVIVDAHGNARIAKAELDHVLAATEAVTASEPKAALEARGEALFNSSRIAKVGESCQSCHTVSGGINAGLGIITHKRDAAQPLSPTNFTGVRQAPSLWDVAETAPYNWVGGNKTLEAQVVGAIKNHFADQDPTPDRVAALTAFLKTIRAPLTRHDQGRLTAHELAGEEVFVGKGGCIACHGGPQFTNNLIFDTDVPQRDFPTLGGPSDDPGSSGIPQGFNVPHLRDIRNTAPYMHNGVFATLRDVVDFYDTNVITGGPRGLTEEEKQALVDYLKTL